MLKRTITALCALAVFFAVVLTGRISLVIGIGVTVFAMLYEVYTAMTQSKAVKLCGYICGMFIMAGMMVGHMVLGTAVTLSFAFTVVLVITMLCAVALHGKVSSREVFSVVLVTIYITMMMSFIPLIRINRSLANMMLVFLIAWGSDTAAYFCGTFFGRHKLIPRVSPKKTVEGSLGAIVCTGILCAAYVLFVHLMHKDLKFFGTGTSEYITVAVLGMVTSALTQLGDLAASAIKRDAGIKDYGKIFPGHGGFMDRFDSVLLAAPVIYFFPLIYYVLTHLN